MFLPYVHYVDEERRGRMLRRVETDAVRREQIEAIWVHPDPPSPEPPAQQAAEREGLRQQILWRECAAVTKIRARGGRVIYVRFPSSGGVLEPRTRRFPRAADLGRAARGDRRAGHPLRGPRGARELRVPRVVASRAADSVEFTRRLMPLLKPYLVAAR